MAAGIKNITLILTDFQWQQELKILLLILINITLVMKKALAENQGFTTDCNCWNKRRYSKEG